MTGEQLSGRTLTKAGGQFLTLQKLIQKGTETNRLTINMTLCITVWQGTVLFVEARHTTEEEQQATKILLHLSTTNLCDAIFPCICQSK